MKYAITEAAWKVMAYGESSSGWAASKINTWLGVIMAVIFLGGVIKIVKKEGKEESEKLKSVGILAVIVIVAAGVAMMFINNQYGGPAGHVSGVAN